MSSQPRRVQELFLEALRADDRQSILAQADPATRRRVELLLEAHDRPGNGLDTPIIGGPDTTSDPQSSSADGVAPGFLLAGRYLLQSRLGQGGMGTVWRARQTAPLPRDVAIKLIRPGFDSATVLARFEAERAALARMDHANIATVYDAGATDDGRPWFALELVDGVALTTYLADHPLPLRSRIELFLPVCRAIEHAHQKGVIHRDLKPGNVLVQVRDGVPTPVVIDFGIAKCADALDTAATAPGMLVGSFETMAPEQLVGDSSAIDTRVDVYALGALLYEVITGKPPFDRDRLRRASLFDLATIIREETPAPPSRHRPKLPADLDWITLRCLEKDRDRRYPNAAALADDLTRFLSGLPVQAGPPTARYRLRKYVARHYRLVTAGALGIAALMAGAAGATWGMLKAQRAEAAALLQRDVADNARQAAETERQRADNEAAIARAVVQFLQNDLLRQADTQYQVATRHDPDTNLTVRAALDRAAEAVDQRFESQPAVESAVRRTIGVAYIGLGEFPKAVVHLKESQALAEKVYGSDHENTHQCQYDYATSLRMVGEFDVAIPLLQKTVAFRQTSPGPNHRNTLAAMTQLAIVFDKVGRHDEASQLFSDVYERATASNANAAVIISALNNLAMCDANRGQLDAVIKRLEALKERWSILTDMPQQVELLNNLGQMYLRARRYDDAIREFTISLAAARKRFSPEHPTLITTTYFLFEAYLHADRKDDAGELIETAHRACRDRVGPNHIRTYLITLKMAEWALATGNTDRGIQLAQSVLRAIENAPRATYTRMSAQVILAHGLLLAGRASEAEPLARAAAGTTGRPDDWLQYHARLVLGKSLASQAKTDEAGPQIEQGRAGLIRHEHQLPFIVRQLLK